LIPHEHVHVPAPATITVFPGSSFILCPDPLDIELQIVRNTNHEQEHALGVPL
jgi:hypothetical protein